MSNAVITPIDLTGEYSRKGALYFNESISFYLLKRKSRKGRVPTQYLLMKSPLEKQYISSLYETPIDNEYFFDFQDTIYKVLLTDTGCRIENRGAEI